MKKIVETDVMYISSQDTIWLMHRIEIMAPNRSHLITYFESEYEDGSGNVLEYQNYIHRLVLDESERVGQL